MSSANSPSGLLAGFAPALSASAGAQSLQINYANAGESVADTAPVPEPARALRMPLGLLGLAARTRFAQTTQEAS